MFGIEIGKYRVIVLSVALFLVFDLGVLVLNFFISSEIAADALRVNLAGRQRMLSQRTAKALYQIKDRLAAGEPIGEDLKELKNAVDLFDTTLLAFREGGTTKGGAGQPVTLQRESDAKARGMLDQADAIWQPYRGKIEELSGVESPSLDSALATSSIARNSNLQLLKLMNEFTSQVEILAANKASRLRMIQVGGITLATVNFLLILFHFLRQMSSADRKVDEAKRETDEILGTVGEGLFLLDRAGRIGSQHSAALARILGQTHLAHADFLSLLRDLVTEKTLLVAKDYIGLLFENQVNEKLVISVNPLDLVEVHLPDGRGGLSSRHLEFRFSRVLIGEEVSHLLVTVNDITRRVQLERELKQSDERAKSQMEMIAQIMHVEPAALAEFLKGVTTGLEQVNAQLKAPGTKTSVDLWRKADTMSRILHGIKGDASSLGLSGLAEAIHEAEDVLKALHARTSLSGNDFLKVTVRLEKLFGRIELLQDVVKRVTHLRSAVGGPGAAESAQVQRWRDFAARIAARQGKEVELSYRGVDFTQLPERSRSALATVVNQFIRNAVVHGIEAPAQRARLGKPAAGRIAIYLTPREDGGLDLSFRDDGRGISLDQIRQRATETGVLRADEAALAEPRRLLGLIFGPGFSTRDQADEDGGRGVGLDLVKAQIAGLGGSIRLRTTPGEHCQFCVGLPPARSLDALPDEPLEAVA